MSLRSTRRERVAGLSFPPRTKSSRGEKESGIWFEIFRKDCTDRSTKAVPPQMTQRCGSRLLICPAERAGSPKFEMTGWIEIFAFGVSCLSCPRDASLLTMQASDIHEIDFAI